MALENIEKEFQVMNETITLLQADLSCSALDALIESFDNLLAGGKIQIEDGLPTEKTVAKLKELYQKIDLSKLSSEEKRALFQLTLLQAYKKEKIQANHQMTPDTIGFIIAYLIEKLVKDQKNKSLLDLTVGTGNLLLAVTSTLAKSGFENLKVYGIDNDDTMLSLASIATQLVGEDVTLYHQDALAPLEVPKVDIVIGDLPIGYYPLDERVKSFKSAFDEGHSYVHHLLIEQALLNLNDGGLGIFTVPSQLFDVPEAKKLLGVIQAEGYLQGFLNLPEKLFINKKSQKALLLIQKKGSKSKQAKPILLGEFPLLKNRPEFLKFMGEIEAWQQANFK